MVTGGLPVSTISHSLFLPPSSLFPNTVSHMQTHTHTHWHLWLQWLPSGEMKSYFCFQITDCQSNKWICSHQRREIDILFSNFNLFSCEGCCLVGLPLTQLFSSILLAIRQWDVDAVCEKGLIFHLSLLCWRTRLNLIQMNICCAFTKCTWMVGDKQNPLQSFGVSFCLNSESYLYVFSRYFIAGSKWKISECSIHENISDIFAHIFVFLLRLIN